MTLLAGLSVGVFVYFLVGFATGYAPNIRIRRLVPGTQISNRQLWLNQAGARGRPGRTDKHTEVPFGRASRPGVPRFRGHGFQAAECCSYSAGLWWANRRWMRGEVVEDFDVIAQVASASNGCERLAP